MDFSEIASTYGSNYRKFKQRSICDGTSQWRGVCQTLVGEYVANMGHVSSLLSTWIRRGGVVVNRHAAGKINTQGWYDETDRIGATYGATLNSGVPDHFAMEVTSAVSKAANGFIALDFDYASGGHQMCFHLRNGSLTFFDPNYGFMDLPRVQKDDSTDVKREKLSKLLGAMKELLELYRVLNGKSLLRWELRAVHSKSGTQFLSGL